MNISVDQLYKDITLSTEEVSKEFGFKRRGTKLIFENEDVYSVIEFQKGQKTKLGSITFTINLSVFCKRLLDPEIDNIDSMRGYNGHLFWRVGDFLSPQSDKWWTLDDATHFQKIKAEISSIFRLCALPNLVKFSKEGQIVNLWESGIAPGISDKRRLFLLAMLKDLQN